MTLMIAASVAVLLQTTALAFAPSAVRSTSRGRTVAGKQHRAQSLAVCSRCRVRASMSGEGEDPEIETLRKQAAALRDEVAAMTAEVDAERVLELASKPPAPVEEVKKPRVVAARPAPVEEEKPKRVTSDDGDKVPWAERALACAPYLLPLSDALPFGNYVFNDFPALVIVLVGPFAPFLAILNAIPFGGFICFLALSQLSRNPEIPKFVRFSMQQAVLLDIALIFPQLIGGLLGATAGKNIPEYLKEPASSTVFLCIMLSILYSVGSNAVGKLPNDLPVVSEAAERSIMQ